MNSNNINNHIASMYYKEYRLQVFGQKFSGLLLDRITMTMSFYTHLNKEVILGYLRRKSNEFYVSPGRSV